MAQKPAQETKNPLDEAAGQSNLPAAPVTNSSFVPGELVSEEEFTLAPSEFPVLKLATSMGELKKHFDEGTVGFLSPEVFEVAPPGEKFDILVVGVRDYWQERRGYQQGNTTPLKEYPTRAAAVAAGENPDWPPFGQPGPEPTVQPAANMLLLVRPAGEALTSAPTVEVFGEFWIPVRFYAARFYYKYAARPVIRAHNMNLKPVGGYTGAMWHGYTAAEGKNEIQALHLGIKRTLTEEERNEFRALLGKFGEVHIPSDSDDGE